MYMDRYIFLQKMHKLLIDRKISTTRHGNRTDGNHIYADETICVSHFIQYRHNLLEVLSLDSFLCFSAIKKNSDLNFCRKRRKSRSHKV
jgi:hypothetical protein